MPKSRSSERKARKLHEDVMKEARRRARNGEDLSPGMEPHIDILVKYATQLAGILHEVHVEAQAEAAAANGDRRLCVVCGEDIIRRYKRGRWPIYCERCSLRDRVD